MCDRSDYLQIVVAIKMLCHRGSLLFIRLRRLLSLILNARSAAVSYGIARL